MLEGITILNEYPIMDYEFNWMAGIIAACIIGIAICAFFIYIKMPLEILPILYVIILCSIVCGTIGTLAGKAVPTSAKEYQVTIEDLCLSTMYMIITK